LSPDEISVHRLDNAVLHPETQRRLSAGAYIGITSALYCLADTATLVLSTAPGQPRATSLLPSIHIAVVRQSQIIPDLKTLYGLLDSDIRDGADPLGNSLTMITGPSKTADIEATMVHGAHGPRALHIIVLTDRDNEPLSV
jgi:L-lactate dehydrogenase complex protein LldG